MTPEQISRMEKYQDELREQLRAIEPPIIILEGDDEYCEIVGNEAAFIRLAIDSLETARKSSQVFEVPLSGRDIPVQIHALKFDPSPEAPIQKEMSWWSNIAAFSIVGAITIIFLTGAFNVFAWIEGLISRVLHR